MKKWLPLHKLLKKKKWIRGEKMREPKSWGEIVFMSNQAWKERKRFSWPRKIGQFTEITNNCKLQQTILVTSIMRNLMMNLIPFVRVSLYSHLKNRLSLIDTPFCLFLIIWLRRCINGLQGKKRVNSNFEIPIIFDGTKKKSE